MSMRAPTAFPPGAVLVAAILLLLLLPRAPFAQASITGVVRDSSGPVLSGVTVEAASPALIVPKGATVDQP